MLFLAKIAVNYDGMGFTGSADEGLLNTDDIVCMIESDLVPKKKSWRVHFRNGENIFVLDSPQDILAASRKGQPQ